MRHSAQLAGNLLGRQDAYAGMWATSSKRLAARHKLCAWGEQTWRECFICCWRSGRVTPLLPAIASSALGYGRRATCQSGEQCAQAEALSDPAQRPHLAARVATKTFNGLIRQFTAQGD